MSSEFSSNGAQSHEFDCEDPGNASIRSSAERKALTDRLILLNLLIWFFYCYWISKDIWSSLWLLDFFFLPATRFSRGNRGANNNHGMEFDGNEKRVHGAGKKSGPLLSGTAYCISSCSMILLNKVVLSGYNFNAGISLMFYQVSYSMLKSSFDWFEKMQVDITSGWFSRLIVVLTHVSFYNFHGYVHCHGFRWSV